MLIRERFAAYPDGYKDVIIMTRKWKFFLGLIPYLAWYDKTTIMSAVNEIDWKLLDKIAEIEKLLSARQAMVKQAVDEMTDVSKHAFDKFMMTEPFDIDEKVFKERVRPMTARIDPQKVTLFLNPQVLRKFEYSKSYQPEQQSQQRRAGNHPGGRPITPGQGGQTTGYTLPEFADKSIHIAEESGVDQVVAFREEKKDDPRVREALGKLKQKHPKRPDETKQEWEERLKPFLQDL